jgi:D-galactarolactone isomerase
MAERLDICDCHVHFFGPEREYPLAEESPYSMPESRLEDYEALMRRLGIVRFVAVQALGYGIDNRRCLDAVQRFNGQARAVVTLPDEVSDAELGRLHKLGARGVRFLGNQVSSFSWTSVETMAARISELGWHVQLQFGGTQIAELEQTLLKLPGKIVFDHYGRHLDRSFPDSATGRVLSRLLERGSCWLKLSAPYLISESQDPEMPDVAVMAKALVQAYPERLLWGSDWPHVGQPGGHDDGSLLSLAIQWVNDATTRKRIFETNAIELYQFGPIGSSMET